MPEGAPTSALGARSVAPSGLRPSSFVMCNTPVEVQFITSAGCLNYPCRTPLGIALGADVTTGWKIGQHLGQRHRSLPLQTAGCRLGDHLAFFGPTTLALRCRGGGRYSSHRLFARHNGSGVARDVTDETILVRLFDQRFMHTARQGARREIGEGTRKSALARNLARALEAAQSAQHGIDGEPLDQPRGRR